MRYTAAIFNYSFAEDWQQDLFEAALGELGFDMFDGNTAYVLTDRLPDIADGLQALLDAHEGVQLLRMEDCEDRNWNEAWEADHPLMELPLGIRIRPHGAFGAGYHETTGMMIDRLLLPHEGRRVHVLDNGCGTGVLGIMAARCGAKHVVMVDIDEQSIANTLENIELNEPRLPDTAFTVVQANTPPDGQFDLIMSNIHRNVLLAQMPLYAARLNGGGELWLSGFYEQDCAALLAEAEHVGLRYKDKIERGEWRLLVLYRPLTA